MHTLPQDSQQKNKTVYGHINGETVNDFQSSHISLCKGSDSKRGDLSIFGGLIWLLEEIDETEISDITFAVMSLTGLCK